jgi:hypothetical protein
MSSPRCESTKIGLDHEGAAAAPKWNGSHAASTAKRITAERTAIFGSFETSMFY